jgi:thioester reductase-like protein
MSRAPNLEALAQVAAALLRTKPENLRPDAPLVRYGLDSMALVELAAELEHKFGCKLDLENLPEAPSLRDLLTAVCAAGEADSTAAPADPFATMLADARLPDGLRCGKRPSPDQPRRLLLTGATGFLGAFLVARLLREPELTLLCLVRCGDPAAGRARVLAALDRYGLAVTGPERIVGLPANLALPGLGLSANDRATAATADAICHLGAAVNWVAPYAALRATNVLATRELLAFARPFHFLSSLAAVYSTLGPPSCKEEDDPLPHLRGLHFGYAQSKAVADSLVMEAGKRGLETTIYRAALLTGDSRSGTSNNEDFLALFLGGCIRLGAAPDLDWAIDACPVDHLVEILARRLCGAPGPEVLHLLNPQARGFREAVLWLNLYGYKVELLPYETWLARLQKALESDPEQPLQKLRGFFATRAEGMYLPELFTEDRRKKAESNATTSWLEGAGIACPPLDTGLLERLTDKLVAGGFWLSPRHSDSDWGLGPGLRRGDGWGDGAIPSSLGSRRIFKAIELDRELFATFFPRLEKAEEIRRGARHSILTELTSWASRRRYGLFRYRLECAGSTPREVLVKVKSADHETIAVARKVATLADPALGAIYGEWAADLGFAKAHPRELALLRQDDPRFRRHTPGVFGIVDDDPAGRWLAICEYLEDVELLDSADDPAGWTPAHFEAAIRGLAALQAIHWGREKELRRESWLGKVLGAADMTAMIPLWHALEAFSRQKFAAWAGPGLEERRRQLIDTIGGWWPELEAQPRTLTHNDFNPRNLCFRRTENGPSLVAYDWELATLQAPQHDLAELLCFVLNEKTSRAELDALVELHRQALQDETGQALDAAAWRRGFDLCLADLMVNRLPMYALVDRFRRQKFLPRVVATWKLLDRFAP